MLNVWGPLHRCMCIAACASTILFYFIYGNRAHCLWMPLHCALLLPNLTSIYVNSSRCVAITGTCNLSWVVDEYSLRCRRFGGGCDHGRLIEDVTARREDDECGSCFRGYGLSNTTGLCVAVCDPGHYLRCCPRPGLGNGPGRTPQRTGQWRPSVNHCEFWS